MIVILSPRPWTHGTLDLKFHSPYFTDEETEPWVGKWWRPPGGLLQFPCLFYGMGAHGWSLLLIMDLCSSGAPWFEPWLYFISVICPGLSVFLFTATSKRMGRFPQDHTWEARSRHRVNASFFPWHPSFSWVEKTSLCRELIVFHVANFSTEKKFNDPDSCPWLWVYHRLGFCQERGSMILFNTYKRTLWRAQNRKWQHWDLSPDPRPLSRSRILHILSLYNEA